MALMISSRMLVQLQKMVAQTAQFVFNFLKMVRDREANLQDCFRAYVLITKAILPGACFVIDVDVLASMFYVTFPCKELKRGNIVCLSDDSTEVPEWSLGQVPHTPTCSSCC